MSSETREAVRRNIRQDEPTASNPLQTVPRPDTGINPGGNIPNTPLASATIAFLLGSVFALGFLTFAVGGFGTYWWTTYQLGFFVAAWAAFHWGEFAVTAGWNLEKCSVDCAFSIHQFCSFINQIT
jgi:protein-S-isoprenylcysteine O-methyltransferase